VNYSKEVIPPNSGWSEILTARESAGYVRLSSSTLAKMRMAGTGPEFMKLGRRVVYAKRALDLWLETHRRQNTSQGASGV